MSLRNNFSANAASQLYVAIIGLVVLPIYLKEMGPEAYGLVGFFTMLQMWFNLMDVGLSHTVTRETARFAAGAVNPGNYRALVRILEMFFFIVGGIACAVLLVSSRYIADDWLNTEEIPLHEVELALVVISLIIPFRWVSGLYRGLITGAEKILWLSAFNAVIASLRFIGVLPLLLVFDGSVIVFFLFHLGVAVIELTLLIIYSYKQIPNKFNPLKKSLYSLSSHFKFSASIAFTSFVWVAITQTDKLILSNLLPLSEYGYFTLGVLMAGVVLLIGGPVSTAILPRMARLEAEGNRDQLIYTYRRATQFVAVMAGSASVVLYFCAEIIILIWTGDHKVAQNVAPILRFYALGNGILVVSAFPYYLQYAKGDMRLHLLGNIIFLIVLFPLIIWAVKNFGGLGAGYAWLCANVVTFVAWLPLVHNKFEPGLNKYWYSMDTTLIFICAFFSGYLASFFMTLEDQSATQILKLILFGAFVFIVTALSSSATRELVVNNKHKLKFRKLLA